MSSSFFNEPFTIGIPEIFLFPPDKGIQRYSVIPYSGIIQEGIYMILIKSI